MKLIEKKGEQVVFTANIDESLANAIRRYMNQIPVLAIDEVEIMKNDSPLYDEAIAHRLGLIPLKTDKITEKANVKLKLVSKKEGAVYSGDLEGNAEIVYDKIPITALTRGQELEISATCRLGKGVEHVKFSPGLMFYRDVSEIVIDKSLAEKVRKICPNNEIKERGDKIIVQDNRKREIADVCEGIGERTGKPIEVKPTGELMITIESFGQMPPQEMFKKSIEQFKKDLAELAKKVAK
jgi:DNA-directed RNA polymerase subunit D